MFLRLFSRVGSIMLMNCAQYLNEALTFDKFLDRDLASHFNVTVRVVYDWAAGSGMSGALQEEITAFIKTR